MIRATAGVIPQNPFTPDFGIPPHILSGRDQIIAQIIGNLEAGPLNPGYTSMVIAPRGAGKTVLLSEVVDKAAESGWLTLEITAGGLGISDRIIEVVKIAQDYYEGAGAADPDAGAPPVQARSTVLKLPGFAFEQSTSRLPGTRPVWSSGTLLERLAEYAASRNTSVLLTVDKLHAADRTELRQLAIDIQRIVKRHNLPLAFLGAALPYVEYTALQDLKMAFFGRIQRVHLPPLTYEEAANGLRDAVEYAGGSIEPEALRIAAEAVVALPYMLQLVGWHAWRTAGAPEKPINKTRCVKAIRIAREEALRTISIPAWHDLDNSEQEYLEVLCANGGSARPEKIALFVPEWTARHLNAVNHQLRVLKLIDLATDGQVNLTDHGPLGFTALAKIIHKSVHSSYL